MFPHIPNCAVLSAHTFLMGLFCQPEIRFASHSSTNNYYGSFLSPHRIYKTNILKMLTSVLILLLALFSDKIKRVVGKVHIHRISSGNTSSSVTTRAAASAQIIYHNGYLMTSNVNIHNIYIGNIAPLTMRYTVVQ